MSLRLSLILAAAALLAGCANGPSGVRVVNGGSGGVADSDKGRTPESIRNLSGGAIGSAIIGKTFQYTRSDGTGFVTYNADGTFDYQDDTKGNGQGRWKASGAQFCETFGTAPTDCGEFKATGDAYFAAKSRLVEMKV